MFVYVSLKLRSCFEDREDQTWNAEGKGCSDRVISDAQARHGASKDERQSRRYLLPLRTSSARAVGTTPYSLEPFELSEAEDDVLSMSVSFFKPKEAKAALSVYEVDVSPCKLPCITLCSAL